MVTGIDLSESLPDKHPARPAALRDIANIADVLAAKVTEVAVSLDLDAITDNKVEKQMIIERIVSMASNTEDIARFMRVIASDTEMYYSGGKR